MALKLYQAWSSGESLVTEVSDNLGWGTSPTLDQQIRIVRALNQTQDVISRRHKFKCLERADSSFVVRGGVQSYVLPSHISKVKTARLIDDDCAVLDRCESGWTAADTDAAVTYESDSSYVRQGKTSLKLALTGDASDGASGIMAYTGLKSGSITAFADAGDSANTIVTSASHGLANGDQITINGSDNYDGTYTIVSVATNTFQIKEDYTAETPSSVTWEKREAPRDLSGYTNAALGFWIYHDGADELDSGAMDIVITSAASGAETGTENTDYVSAAVNTAIQENTWTYVKLTGLNFTNIDDFVSVGIKDNSTSGDGSQDIHTANGADINIYFDQFILYDQSYGGNSWPMHVITANTLDRCVPNPKYISEYRPTVFAVSGDEDEASTVEVFRVPDDNYPVWMRYYKKPRAFSTANDGTDLTYSDWKSEYIDLDDVLTAGATWLMFAKAREYEDANQWIATFRRLLTEAILDDEKRDGWEPVIGEGVVEFVGNLGELPANEQGSARDSTEGYFYFY